MAEVRYKTVGSSITSPTSMMRRKEILVPQELTDYTLHYHYGDLDKTPVRGVPFRATFVNGETREGALDDQGLAKLMGVPRGPVCVSYQYQTPDTDDDAIVAARDKIRQALDAIAAQTKLDMADEWKEWNEANWLTRRYLEALHTAKGPTVGAWHWLSGMVDCVWQLAVLSYKFDKEALKLHYLFATGQWAALDKEIDRLRKKGTAVLGEASEVKELLNLIFHDEKTRDIIQDGVVAWWAAIPPDEQAELAISGGMQIALDLFIGVLLSSFSAGAGGAAYGSAKWAATGWRLGVRVKKLLDALREAFESLAKALKARKRKVVELKSADGAKKIETIWKPMAAELARLS
jgi:hypothetical protein